MGCEVVWLKLQNHLLKLKGRSSVYLFSLLNIQHIYLEISRMPLSPQFKRNISRIIPFGLIWLFIGWFFTLSEALLPQTQAQQDATDIALNFPVFLFAAFSLTSLGLLVGTLETLVFQKRFQAYSFLRKILFKFMIYLAVMVLAISITYPTAASIEANSSFFDAEVWNKTSAFLLSPRFFNALLQLSFSLLLSLLYSAISENLGHHVLLNFYTGKYHKPVVEERIFMFLDMKQSTTIAEGLGHEAYFKLLQAYYEIMSDPIINSQGEVYQYIGDEVVITWSSKKGLMKNNCIECFREIKENLSRNAASFQEKYGVVPDFKAAIHLGEVTTGEIGALKKEVIYTGDVLNTTARVQALCNEKQADLLITEDLLKGLELPNEVKQEFIGELPLKGKTQPVKLHKVYH